MPFKKGHKGAKPKGSKSMRTIEWESFGRELLDKGMPRALEILATCEPNMFMNHFTGLLEYFKPKLSRVDSTVDMKADINNFIIELSDENITPIQEVDKTTEEEKE